MDDTEREWIDRARAGDNAAFTKLVVRHGPRVRRLAHHLVRGHADSDDLAQEAFVRAYEALGRFDGRSEFFTWIYRIVVNLSLNRTRSLSVRKSAALDDPSVTHDLQSSLAAKGVSTDPSVGLADRRLVAAVAREVDLLPTALRTTLILVCVDGMPQEQAAEVLGCTAGTVAWRVHEARKRLRLQLRDRGFELPAKEARDSDPRDDGDRAGGGDFE